MLELQRFPYQDRAAGGFAVVLVNVIELGLNAAAHRSEAEQCNSDSVDHVTADHPF